MRERAQVVDAYRSRVGELVNGQVKKVTREAVIVDLGNNAEAILRREEWIPRETFRIGDRLRALLEEVRPEARGPQLALTRTSPAAGERGTGRSCSRRITRNRKAR